MHAERLVEYNRIDDAFLCNKRSHRNWAKFSDPGIVVPMFVLKCRIEITKQDYQEAKRYLEKANSCT